MKRRYKKPNPKSFFDEEYRRSALANLRHPLRRLDDEVNWEIFRKPLEKYFEKTPKGPGGRPPFDLVMMFKVLVVQRTYNLSDERTQFSINDSLSIQDFLGLTLADNAPDEKTIWAFREVLAKANGVQHLFRTFDGELRSKGLIINKGSIVDASFVEVPIQRNTREENETIKAGKIPVEWKKEENTHKLAQKDTEARWTQKNDEDYYGYKDHVKVDAESKLITKHSVSDASVHDSQEIKSLLSKDDKDKDLHADSAYAGEPIAELLEAKGIGNKINERAYRNTPLTKSQIRSNRRKSRIRARIEHVFGFIENSLHGSTLRSIGMTRAIFGIGLMNLVYNMFRAEQISRLIHTE